MTANLLAYIAMGMSIAHKATEANPKLSAFLAKPTAHSFIVRILYDDRCHP